MDQSRKEHIDVLATAMVGLFGGLGPLLFGFDLGVSPGALHSITASSTLNPHHGSPHNPWQPWLLSLLPSVSLCGALLISLIALCAGNFLGRKTELFVAALCYGCSSILCRFARTLKQLLLLRALYGVAIGVSMHASPPYLAETCPAPVRGLVFGLKETLIVAGILKGYLVSSTFLHTTEGWRCMYVAAAPVALLMVVGVWLLPESPRWLLLQDWRQARVIARAAAAASSNEVAGRQLMEHLSSHPAFLHAEGSEPALTIIDSSDYEASSTSLVHQARSAWQQPWPAHQQSGSNPSSHQGSPGQSWNASAGSSLQSPASSSLHTPGPSSTPQQPPPPLHSQQPSPGTAQPWWPKLLGQRRLHDPIGTAAASPVSTVGSPVYGVVQQPGRNRARAALERAWGRRCLHRPDAVEVEMAGMIQSGKEASSYGITGLRLLVWPLYYRPLAAGILLMLFAQVTGQPAVMFESTKILADAGVQTAHDEIVGAVRLIMTLVAAATVDIWGRRPLLLLGASGTVLALAALAASQWAAIVDYTGAKVHAWIGVGSMLCFLGCFQVSFGPLSWLYIGEIFPLAVRGPAIAAANITGFACSLLVQLLMPYLQGTLGTSGIFCMFALVSVCAVLTVHTLIPETKGLTLEQIEHSWKGRQALPSNLETTSLSEWLTSS